MSQEESRQPLMLYTGVTACSWAVQIALTIAKLPFETCWIRPGWTLANGQSYLDINPRAQVPALVLEDGEVFTETIVLLRMVADRAPKSGLSPTAGTQAFYRMSEMLCYLATEYHKNALAPLSHIHSFPNGGDDLREFFMNRLRRCLDYLEDRVGDGRYFMSDQFWLVDAYLAVMLYWADLRVGTLANWPRLERYHARLSLHPAVVETLTSNLDQKALRERSKRSEAG